MLTHKNSSSCRMRGPHPGSSNPSLSCRFVFSFNLIMIVKNTLGFHIISRPFLIFCTFNPDSGRFANLSRSFHMSIWKRNHCKHLERRAPTPQKQANKTPKIQTGRRLDEPPVCHIGQSLASYTPDMDHCPVVSRDIELKTSSDQTLRPQRCARHYLQASCFCHC